MNLSDFQAAVPTPLQVRQLEYYTEKFALLAADILAQVPATAHRTAALRLLLEAKMTLIHGITHEV